MRQEKVVQVRSVNCDDMRRIDVMSPLTGRIEFSLVAPIADDVWHAKETHRAIGCAFLRVLA